MAPERELAGLLDEQLKVARTMLAALDAEHEALRLGNTDFLNAAGAEKAQLVTELEQLEQERQLMVQVTGQPSSSEARKSWSDLLGLMAECQKRNEQNGSLVRWRREHVARALRVLRGEQLELYDASGVTGVAAESNSLGEA